MAATKKYPPFLQATDAFAVTPSDTLALAADPNNTSYQYPIACIYVGGAGNLKCVTADGSTVTFTGLLAGTFVPVLVKQVFATLTTTTNMVALVGTAGPA